MSYAVPTGCVVTIPGHIFLGILVEIDVDGWWLGKLPFLERDCVGVDFASCGGVAELVECSLSAREIGKTAPLWVYRCLCRPGIPCSTS